MFDKFIEGLAKLLAVFGLCAHKWVIYKDVNLLATDTEAVIFTSDQSKWRTSVGNRYHLRCTKCGNMKAKEFSS